MDMQKGTAQLKFEALFHRHLATAFASNSNSLFTIEDKKSRISLPEVGWFDAASGKDSESSSSSSSSRVESTSSLWRTQMLWRIMHAWMTRQTRAFQAWPCHSMATLRILQRLASMPHACSTSWRARLCTLLKTRLLKAREQR